MTPRIRTKNDHGEKSAQRGFTLVEFIIYAFVVGIVLFAVGAVGLNAVFSKARLIAMEEVDQNGRLAIEKMAQAIRNAQAVNNIAPGATAENISLQMADPAANPTVFDLFGGGARVRRGLGATHGLTANAVTVAALQFDNMASFGAPAAIRIRLTVRAVNSQGRPEYDFEKTFYTTATLRAR